MPCSRYNTLLQPVSDEVTRHPEDQIRMPAIQLRQRRGRSASRRTSELRVSLVMHLGSAHRLPDGLGNHTPPVGGILRGAERGDWEERQKRRERQKRQIDAGGPTPCPRSPRPVPPITRAPRTTSISHKPSAIRQLAGACRNRTDQRRHRRLSTVLKTARATRPDPPP